MRKKKKDYNYGGAIGCLIYIVLVVACIAIPIAIANSDMPFWVKWWLLK